MSKLKDFYYSYMDFFYSYPLEDILSVMLLSLIFLLGFACLLREIAIKNGLFFKEPKKK